MADLVTIIKKKLCKYMLSERLKLQNFNFICIPKVVVGENQTFQGPEVYLQSRGVEVEVLNDKDCIRMMRDFILANPVLWNEDIGE